MNLLHHHQSRVKVHLTHLIKCRLDIIVLVVLARRYRSDRKVVRTHWLIDLHMPTFNVLASIVQRCTTIVEWFYTCTTMEAAANSKLVYVIGWYGQGFETRSS